MSLRRVSSTGVTVLVVALLVVGGAAAFAVREWLADRDARAELAATESFGSVAADLADEVARLDDETSRLSREAEGLREQLAEARRREMPLDNASTQQVRLSLLRLAARCDMHVIEVSQIDEPARAVPLVLGREASTKVTKESTEAFLRRFSGPAPRPLVKLIAAAEYPAVHRFMAELGALRWNATPAYFALDGAHESMTVENEFDIAGAAVERRLGHDGRLLLTLLVAL